MGTNIELNILLRKEDFSFWSLFSLFESLLARQGYVVSIHDILVFDDWTYANQRHLPVAVVGQADTLFLQKFSRIAFLVNNRWNCTLLTATSESGSIEWSLALNTDELVHLLQGHMNQFVEEFFGYIAHILDDLVGKEPLNKLFVAAAMGIEYSVRFHEDILTLLNDDNGVFKWVFPKQLVGSITSEQFRKESQIHTVVFTQVHKGYLHYF